MQVPNHLIRLRLVQPIIVGSVLIFSLNLPQQCFYILGQDYFPFFSSCFSYRMFIQLSESCLSLNKMDFVFFYACFLFILLGLIIYPHLFAAFSFQGVLITIMVFLPLVTFQELVQISIQHSLFLSMKKYKHFSLKEYKFI
jgi:hypothetical protein